MGIVLSFDAPIANAPHHTHTHTQTHTHTHTHIHTQAPTLGEGHDLDHRHNDGVVGRGDPEVGGHAPAPRELAGALDLDVACVCVFLGCFYYFFKRVCVLFWGGVCVCLGLFFGVCVCLWSVGGVVGWGLLGACVSRAY